MKPGPKKSAFKKKMLRVAKETESTIYTRYLEPESILVVNNNPDDKDLKPIEIPVPLAEDVTKVTGYGKPAVAQFFVRHADLYPGPYKRLMALQKKCDTVSECIETLRKNPDQWEEEIDYIQREWDFRMRGYHFFNMGRPTYITGTHWLYLNHWYAGKYHPDYRSRDRKFYLFADFVEKDPLACGFNYPKFRREGATSKTSCLMYDIITKERGVHGGIQSKDDKSAENVFQKHIVQSWKKMPFWFRPLHDGRSEPKKSLNFFAPGKSSGEGTAAGFIDSLESWIDFEASTAGAYDGTKLRFHYGDEVGKTKEVDIYERHLIVRPCVTEGNKYIGLIINTSTVGDMEKGGGDSFKKLCKNSHYESRNDNGETLTGLYNFFIPSYDGFSGTDPKTGKPFTNRYGDSDEKATKEYLLRRRNALLEAGDIEGYVEEVRQFPLTFAECFTKSSRQANFNTQILADRLAEFQFGNPHKVTGNFEWTDGRDSKVIWIPSKTGRFTASYLLPEGFSGRQVVERGVRVPGNRHRFIAGGDPFKQNETKTNVRSDGAGAVYMKFDPAIDDPNGDPKLWKTDRFVCTYSNRTRTTDEYAEDMLKMCVYYGCEMYPEVNVDLLWKHFRERGYSGYLYYSVDAKTGKYNKTPGESTNTKIIQTIYAEWYNYIERNGMRELHDELLEQCRDIEDDMGPYDLFVAGGYALMGARRQESAPSQVKDVKAFHRKFTYSS